MNQKVKLPYEKPIVVREAFRPIRIIFGGVKIIICRQCSACHGCR